MFKELFSENEKRVGLALFLSRRLTPHHSGLKLDILPFRKLNHGHCDIHTHFTGRFKSIMNLKRQLKRE